MRRKVSDSGHQRQLTALPQLSQSQPTQSRPSVHKSNRKFPKLSVAATLLLGFSNILPKAVKANQSDDLLQGSGIFDKSEIDPRWIAVNPNSEGMPEAYNTIVHLPQEDDIDRNNYYLEMQKTQGANGFFDDGFTFVFTVADEETGEQVLQTDLKPRHLSFQVMTLDEEGESCDIRLYSVKRKEEESINNDTETATDEVDNGQTEEPDVDPDQDDGQTEPQRRRMEEDGDDLEGGEQDVAEPVDPETLLLGNEIIEEQGQDDISNDNQEVEEVLLEEIDEELHDEEDHLETIIAQLESAPNGPNDLWEKEELSDIVLFRFGWFNYMKLNTQSMVKKFEKDTWYTINLILDYDNQRVSIYVSTDDGAPEPITSEVFFTKRTTKLDSVNALSIYGLTPGNTSRFRDIKMCNEICAGTEIEGIEFTDITGAASLMQHFANLSYTTLAGLTALALAFTA